MSKYSSYILFLLLTILVVILYANDFSPMARVQQSLNDLLCRVTATDDVPSNVVMVQVDGRATSEYGEWPWNQSLIADLMAAVSTAEPRAMVVTFDLSEDVAQNSAGHTDVLASQIGWMSTAVLPYDVALATFRSSRTNNPDHLFKWSMNVDNQLGLLNERSTLQARKVFLPADKILASDPMLGFDYTMPDDDRVLRHQALAMNYEGYYYPSQTLLAAALYYGVPIDQVKIIEGNKVSIGSEFDIPINSMTEYYIKYPSEFNFMTYSAADVLGEGFNMANLKDKAVILCAEDFNNTEYFVTPSNDNTPEYAVTATVLSNFINKDVIIPQRGGKAMYLLILFVIGGLCAYFLPQVSMLYRAVILGCGIFILANVNFFMVSSFGILPDTVFIALELLLFIIAAPILETRLISGAEEPAKQTKAESIAAKKFSREEIAAAEAAAPVRQIISKATDQENVETAMIAADSGPTTFDDHSAINLDEPNSDDKTSAFASNTDSTSAGFEFEDKEEAPKPEIITPNNSFDHSTIDPDAGEYDADSWRNDSAKSTMSDSSGSSTELTNLGRYQILGTLGKGAMGHVYKGIDPAINRPVALKTIRLDFVNDPEEMEELKERLFREAQAAGKLSHPNIVTIYDVGSEGHLQYIAMEFIEGVTLEEMIKRKAKFSYKILSQIIIQICSALDYAHERKIVHRDIKPANIMVTENYTAKVMDYGIARVDSSSMTKTGIAMGTPNYISPEQLQGKSVDHRADLFSLGVVMYELLLGRRPFKGENITALIYAILNHDPEKPSTVNPQIPLLFDHIIAKALKKNPAERYQKASEITTDLSDFVEAFSR
jgi:serine/threonine-protein kinase